MQLPNKIGIIDSTKAEDSKLRFDQWEGYDSILQRKYLAVKINEIIDFLSGHPTLPNDYPTKLEQTPEGNIQHVHEWRLNQRLGAKAFYDCKVCGEIEIRFKSPTEAS